MIFYLRRDGKIKNKEIIAIIIIICITLSLVFFSLQNNISKDLKNQSKNDDVKKDLDIDIYPNSIELDQIKQNILSDINISETANITMYQTDSDIEEIIDWYSIKENIKNWTIDSSGLSGNGSVSQGYVKLKNNDEGVYIFFNKIENITYFTIILDKWSEIINY